MDRSDEIEEWFPKLRKGGYHVTSCSDSLYNCIAFACDDKTRWWEYGAEHHKVKTYWPAGLPPGDTVKRLCRVFFREGYRRTTNDDFESGFEKVAIYAYPDGFPSHVARQTTTGKWKSKCGEGCDIEHDSLDTLEGSRVTEFGAVAQFLKRKRARRGRRGKTPKL